MTTKKNQPMRVDGRTRRMHGPTPLNSFVMVLDGRERLIKKAYAIESADSRRILSGRHSVLVMMDLAEMAGTEDWYGFEMPPAEARKLAASLNALADGIYLRNQPALSDEEAPAKVSPTIQAMADMSVLGHLFQQDDAITAQDFLAAASGAEDDERQFQEAEQDAIEAQRQHAHDADIASRGYEPYGEREE